MKVLTRSYIWWPRIDNEIEKTAKPCSGCKLMQVEPITATVHPWECPSSHWPHPYIDFTGPFLGCMFLIVADAYSRWLQIEKMDITISAKTIEKLQNLFARYGVPAQLVSDNGAQYKIRRVQAVPQEKWNQTHHVSTIPPCQQWSSRALCAEFQISHEKWNRS